MRRHRRWIVGGLVAVMLGQMLVAMLTAAREQSPTVDEPVYVGVAVSYLEQHSLQLNPEHPPLAKLVSAVGLGFADARFDPTYRGSQWNVGHGVLYTWGNDGDRVLFLARVPLIVLTLLFGLVVFAFAYELFGAAGGLVALALYSFSPDVIAHGSLATNDVAVAGFLLTTMWLLWRSHRAVIGGRPRLYVLLAGVSYGAAVATKFIALALFPVVLFLAGLTGWRTTRTRPVLRSALTAVGIGTVAVATVWGVYLAVDPALRFQWPATMPYPSDTKRQAVDLLPFPSPFRAGLLLQLAIEEQSFGGYLFGQSYSGSRWYYLPAALLVKTPLGMIVLWLGAVGTLLLVRRLRPVALYLLLPLAVLLPIAMTGSRSLGVRYVIFMPMFLAVAAAAVLTLRYRWAAPVALALVVFVAVSSLRAFPYYLPYSNEAFGGPGKTHLHLNDSNVDWGQDLRRLGEYLAVHPTNERIWLLYKGRGDPAYYGIYATDATTVPPDQVHGVLAVSVMRLSMSPTRHEELIGGRTPVAIIGHTIQIYHLP
jgi:hypothetical protein